MPHAHVSVQNYLGTVHAIRAVINGVDGGAGMRARAQGRILLVSSGMAMTAFIGFAAYAPVGALSFSSLVHVYCSCDRLLFRAARVRVRLAVIHSIRS
jgi:hypothetical protein